MSRELTVACQLAKQMGVQVDPNYRWKMAAVNGGDHLRPSEMRTGHLFNVVKMIWNNKMPAHMRVGSVKLYQFGASHSDEYLKTSICHLMAELMQRNDLTFDQVSMLQEMHSHLYAGKEPLPLPQPVRFCPWQLNVK